MRKFLAILLIAVIACSTSEEDKDSFLETIKKWYLELENMGVIDAILNLLTTQGLPVAKEACCTYIPDACSICETLIKYIELELNY